MALKAINMISNNISELGLKINSACQRSGRRPDEVKIVAVTKTATVEQILKALAAGIDNIGENRVQDAAYKFNEIRNTQYASRIKWHMVGHLQTNKVKEAVRIFDLIHSVDSEKIGVEIDKQAAKINKVQDILVEVNISQEPTKFGLKPEEAVEVIAEIAQLKSICIKGLMTIAPFVDNPRDVRSFFSQLRKLRGKLNELRVTDYELRELSMGMTDDFEVAIEEGSTIVRIGRAIFKG